MIYILLALTILSVVNSQISHGDDYGEFDVLPNGTCISQYCIIMNSSTCEEFLRGTKFDPNRVLNVDWKIFYFWNYLQEGSYQIRFSVPSKMLLDRYKILLGTELKDVVWSDAELFMETSRDVSGLLMKTNTSGLYRFISMEIYDVMMEVPPIIVAMKLVDRYLGLLDCTKRVCFALAPVDRMPEATQLTSAASKLHFHSEVGRSYLTPLPVVNYTLKRDLFDEDHDDEDHDYE